MAKTLDELINKPHIAFCEECRKDVQYETQWRPYVVTIKGKECSYIGKEAICTECKARVWVPEIIDENIDAFNAAADISEILKKATGQ